MLWKKALVLAVSALVGCAQPASDQESLGSSESALTTCGTCPIGYHPVGYACNDVTCPYCRTACEPDTPPSFSQCGNICPSAYHATHRTCDTISCGNNCWPGQNTNAAACALNDSATFPMCGTSCPPGYHVTSSYCDGFNCGSCALSAPPNAVTCQIDNICDINTSNIIGYGQMGHNDACQHRDVCAAGLTPQNVDSRPGLGYPRADDGYFSCWYNTPDVNCSSKSKINGYINVRVCYIRPDGSKVNYGCNDC